MGQSHSRYVAWRRSSQHPLQERRALIPAGGGVEGGASGAAASPSDLRKAETLEDIWSELPVAGAKLRASLCLSKRGVGKSRSFIFPAHIRHLLHCQSWPVWCSWANCTGPGPECLGLLHCSLHCSLYCLLLTAQYTVHSTAHSTVHSTSHSLTHSPTVITESCACSGE